MKVVSTYVLINVSVSTFTYSDILVFYFDYSNFLIAVKVQPETVSALLASKGHGGWPLSENKIMKLLTSAAGILSSPQWNFQVSKYRASEVMKSDIDKIISFLLFWV